MIRIPIDINDPSKDLVFLNFGEAKKYLEGIRKYNSNFIIKGKIKKKVGDR